MRVGLSVVLALCLGLLVVGNEIGEGSEDSTMDIAVDGIVGGHPHEREDEKTALPPSEEASSTPEEANDLPLIEINAGSYIMPWEGLTTEEKLKRRERFFGWLNEEGVRAAAGLDIEEIPEMEGQRGLRAGEPIPKQSTVLHIPQHVLISSLPPVEGAPDDTPYCDLTRRWPIGLIKKVFETAPFLEEGKADLRHRIQPGRVSRVFLALCLIHETKKMGGSFYQPYLDLLPQQFRQPLTWRRSAVEQLRGSPMYDAVLAAKKQLEDDYHLMAEILFTVGPPLSL